MIRRRQLASRARRLAPLCPSAARRRSDSGKEQRSNRLARRCVAWMRLWVTRSWGKSVTPAKAREPRRGVLNNALQHAVRPKAQSRITAGTSRRARIHNQSSALIDVPTATIRDCAFAVFGAKERSPGPDWRPSEGTARRPSSTSVPANPSSSDQRTGSTES
jgi:hypothetical protein